MHRVLFTVSLLALAGCGGSTIDPTAASPGGAPASGNRPAGGEPDSTAPGGSPLTPPASSGTCDHGARTFASGEGIPAAIAVDDRYVYWLTDAGAGAGGGTKLRAAETCRHAPAVTLATGPYFSRGLSVDASGVYFTSASGGSGRVAWLPKEQTAPGTWSFGKELTVEGEFEPADIEAGSQGAITWVEPNAGTVAGVGKDGTRVVLYAGLDHPEHLAYDGRDMFVGTRSGLFRLDAGSATNVARGEVRGLTSNRATFDVFSLTRDTAYRFTSSQRQVLLASFSSAIDDVAASAKDLVFVHDDVVKIAGFPVGGGPTSSPLDTGGKGPGRVAADDSGIYYAAGGVITRITSLLP